LPAHDPAKAPLAAQVRYTENGVELPLPDSLWRTASAVGKYRLKVSDPELGDIGFFAKMEENERKQHRETHYLPSAPHGPEG
jgi:hypothetical protein